MLLKYSQFQKRSKLGANGKPQRASITGSNKIAPNKGHRRGKGVGSKKLNGGNKNLGSKREEVRVVTSVDPCDNSNDSGLGFDHSDYQPCHHSFTHSQWSEEARGHKRARVVDIKLESDDANDNFTFPQLHSFHPPPSVEKAIRRVEIGGKAGGRSVGKRGAGGVGAGSPSVAKSRDGKIQLEIISQPETQHRARYQTEGSRGAVKDTTGNSFPLVKLSGYVGAETAVLQVYIGTDQGKVAPHMFYQACKVSGKNSTPCFEKKLNGTVVIEIEFNPSKDMLVLCDCVGILKERNVDVEHRFPEESTAKSRKKSTRCRMVFRTTVNLKDGSQETLQVISHPIVCTQPPGVPEICKKSLSSCPVSGGVELFVIGKNFLKDTRVRFSEGNQGASDYWECTVQPDKEYLHQSHLVCTIPRYHVEDIKEAVTVSVSIISGGKSSEMVPFVFTPMGSLPLQQIPAATTSYYAVAQDLGSDNQTTVINRIPEVPSFSSPQKIIISSTGITLTTPQVISCLSSENNLNKGVKEEVWLKTEEMDLLSASTIGSSLTQSNGLNQNLSQQNNLVLTSNLVQPVSIAQGTQVAQNLVHTSHLLHSPGIVASNNMEHSSSVVQNIPINSQATNLSHSPSLVQTVNLTHSSGLVQAQSLPLSSDLAQSTGLVHQPSLMQSPNMSTSQTLVPSGSLNHSTMLQSSSGTGLISPINSNQVQASSILENSILQSSNMVDSSSLLQPQSLINQSNIMSSADMVMRDPNIVDSSTLIHSPNISEASNIIQNPNIVKSPNIIQTNMGETSCIMQTESILETSNLIQSSNVDSGNLMPTSIVESSSLMTTPNSSSNILHSPNIRDSPNIIHSPNIRDAPSLLHSPNLMESSSIIRSPDSTTMIQSTNIVDSTNIMDNNSVVEPSSIISASSSLSDMSNNSALLTSPNMVTANNMQNSMAESSSMIQSNSFVESGVMQAPSIVESSMMQTPHMVESSNLMQNQNMNSNLMQTSGILEPSNLVRNSNSVEPANLMQSSVIDSPLQGSNIVEASAGMMQPSNMIENSGLLQQTSHLINPSNGDRRNTLPEDMIELKSNDRSDLGPSMATLEKYISTTPLPALSVETYLSHIENKPKQVYEPPLLTTISNENSKNQEAMVYSQNKNIMMDSYSNQSFIQTSHFEQIPSYNNFTNNGSSSTKQKPSNDQPTSVQNGKKCEEGIPVPHELTVMSENDLISYINPSCFDQV